MTSYVSIKPNVSSTRVAGNARAPVRQSSQESNKEDQYERISAANVVPTLVLSSIYIIIMIMTSICAILKHAYYRVCVVW